MKTMHMLRALALTGLLGLLHNAHALLPVAHWQQPSGARVYLVESHNIPMVDVQIDLDAGSRRHVREGLAVIDADGVVGQVVEVTPLNSTVVLISDPSHAIPVQVVRSGLRAIAYAVFQQFDGELVHLVFL